MSPPRTRFRPPRVVAVVALATGLAAAPAHAAQPRPEPLWDAFPLREKAAGPRERPSRPTTIHGTTPAPRPGSDDSGAVVLALLVVMGAAGAIAVVRGRHGSPAAAPAPLPFAEPPPVVPPRPPSRPPQQQRAPRVARNTERPDRRHPGRGGNVPSRGRRR